MDGRLERRDADSERVVLGPAFCARLERFAALARARGARADGRAGLAPGQGVELDGHRPYRDGEDLRDLDWELLARLGRPWMRVRRAERGERAVLALDTSASMSVGAPSKLEHACELAAAVALATVGSGGRAEVVAHGAEGRVERCALRSRRDLPSLLEFLRRRIARGERSLRELFALSGLARSSRVVVLGDLMDVEPADVLALARRGCRVSVAAVLARRELSPRASEGIEWFDPERGDTLALALDSGVLSAYGRALEGRLELWRAAFARRGQAFCVTPSDAQFETLALELVR
ncbi:MAG: DUF58 domain-containing protein [Planctomycetes bacterium]|nr:DUF58 domain-containing protein [Planctomycetota bacterium]